jgi:hypothetical protein
MKLGLVAGLILLLFKVLAGKYAILASPLAASLTSTVHASQLCLHPVHSLANKCENLH